MDNDNEVNVSLQCNPSSGGDGVDPSLGERSAEMGELASSQSEVTRRVRNPLCRREPAAVTPACSASLAVTPASSASSVVDSILSDTTPSVAPRLEVSGNLHLLSITPAPIADSRSVDREGGGPTNLWKSGHKAIIIIAAVVVAGAAADFVVWRISAKRHAGTVLSVAAPASAAGTEGPATLSATNNAATTLPEIAPLPSNTPIQTPVASPSEAIMHAGKEVSRPPLKLNAPRDTRSARPLGTSNRKTLVKGTSKSVDDLGMAARPGTTRPTTSNIDETDPYSP